MKPRCTGRVLGSNQRVCTFVPPDYVRLHQELRRNGKTEPNKKDHGITQRVEEANKTNFTVDATRVSVMDLAWTGRVRGR